jgi:hypothetical protein
MNCHHKKNRPFRVRNNNRKLPLMKKLSEESRRQQEFLIQWYLN